MKALQLVIVAVGFMAGCCFSIFAASSTKASGSVVGIVDGDTFVVLTAQNEKLTVRLSSIDAPEKAQPYAQKSKALLSSLIFGREVALEVMGNDQYGRLIASVTCQGRIVENEMLIRGGAWVYRKYSDDPELIRLEREAMDNHLGLWGLPESQKMPPWEWRMMSSQNKRSFLSVDGKFSCGAEKHCKEMNSCSEARFHLQNCGESSLDGDGDGIPCESLCVQR